MASPCIDESHRKELLKFLLVKTAAVRRGVKPAELLRVRHCPEGGDVCEFLAELARRFVKDGMPHEVGVFVWNDRGGCRENRRRPDTNESDKTDEKVAAWTAALKAAI